MATDSGWSSLLRLQYYGSCPATSNQSEAAPSQPAAHLLDQSLERPAPDEQVGALLVLPDLTQCHGAGAVAVALGDLACSLGQWQPMGQWQPGGQSVAASAWAVAASGQRQPGRQWQAAVGQWQPGAVAARQWAVAASGAVCDRAGVDAGCPGCMAVGLAAPCT